MNGHIDSRDSLNPSGDVSPAMELIGLVERLAVAERKVGDASRLLSDASREKALVLEEIGLFWMKERIESLSDEPLDKQIFGMEE